MKVDAIEDAVCRVVANVLNVARATITIETSRDNLAAWDSLKHMYVVMALEDELGIEFTDKDIAQAASIRSLVSVVSARTKVVG